MVAGARGLDCALYLAIQLEQIEAIAILLLCKSTIVGDYMAIRSLLSEPPESDNVPWYMPEVHRVLANGAIKMSYPIAVSIMEKNYESTKELLLKTDLDMGQKRVDWSKLKLTLLHSSWVYSIAPWVVSLKLVNNHLRKLPKELFQAMQLRRLDLSHNLLETVPGEIFGLPNLEYLCLAHNQLLDLPETSNWSSSLLTLDLSDNRLTTLPTGIQHSAVEILNLSKNQFTMLPKCLCRIKTLTSLDLSHMPVSSWPKEMENLDKLVNLNVTSTNISDLAGRGGILRGGLKGVFKAKGRSSKPCNYIKLILLCHSTKVKRVMLARLKPHFLPQGDLPEMEVFQWSYRPLFTFRTPKLHFNTWVVGSALEVSALYPCLFTAAALNVIVWDLTKTADMREQIKVYVDLLVRYIPHANIFVITILPDIPEHVSDSNADTLAKRLKTFFAASCYKSLRFLGMFLLAANPNIKDGNSDMKQCLYDTAMLMTVNNQPLVSRLCPENYFSIIPVLEKEQKAFATRGQPGILEEVALWNMFQQALSADSPDYMELPVIVEFLQETGFLLHFEDPNDHLDQYYFIQPMWLYQALLKILRHCLDHPSRVIVTTGDLVSLTSIKWNLSATAPLIRLMIRFAIIIPTKPNQFLVPSLLPHCSPSTASLFCGNLRRQFAPKVKPLPSDLWSRLVGRILSDLPRLVNMAGTGVTPPRLDSNSVQERDTDEETDSNNTESVKSPVPMVISPVPVVTSPSSSTNVATSYARLHLATRSTIEESDDDLCSPSMETVTDVTRGTKDLSNSQPQTPEGTNTLAEDSQLSIQEELSAGQNVLPKSEPTETVDGKPSLSKSEETTYTSEMQSLADDFNHPDDSTHRAKFRKQVTVGSPYRYKPQEVTVERHATFPDRLRQGRSITTPPQKRGTRSRSQVDPMRYQKHTAMWDSGIVYRDDTVEFSIYPCLCDVSSVDERGIEVCSTKNEVGRIVLARLCRLVQKLLEERYPELFSVELILQKHELTQLAICPVCLEQKERSPQSFLVEACVHALGDNVQHNCRYHPETIPIYDMVPDYLMLDLPSELRVEPSMFKIDEGKLLHKGRGAHLHHGYFKGESVAIKVYQHAHGKSITLPLSFVRQDMEMLSTITHPNIVRSFGFCLNPPCVIIEKAPLGNLYEKLMDTEQKISRLIRFHICCQVMSGITFLHSQNIIYRTLKASSILVWSLQFQDEVNVKLANLERASFQSPSGLLGRPAFSSYPAPEMLKYSFKEEYSEKVDIYSFGILLYELVTRWQPFTGVYNTDRLPSNQRPKITSAATNGYATLVRLMEECWQEDPSLRPSAFSLLKRLSQPSFQCHIASQVLRDCVAVRGCCFVPSVRQIWVYGEYDQAALGGDGSIAEGTQVFILNADSLTVQGSLELKERVSSILAVDNKVWIGMTEACVHAYDTTTFQFTDRLHLADSVTCIASNDTFMFVAQANGHLKCYPKLVLPKDSGTIDIEVGNKAIIAMETVGDIVWLSCGNELVILSTEDEITIEARWNACGPSDQVYSLVLSKDATLIWSLFRGELAITSWDVHTGKMKHRVDLTEELNWVCCEINYDPTYLRLVSLECVGDTLWMGLTCGVIVILSADEQPKVVTRFRAHRSSPKCLLDIPKQEGSRDTHVVLSGGFGEIFHSSNLSSEQNGVIISWQALTMDQFRLVTHRHKDIQKMD